MTRNRLPAPLRRMRALFWLLASLAATLAAGMLAGSLAYAHAGHGGTELHSHAELLAIVVLIAAGAACALRARRARR